MPREAHSERAAALALEEQLERVARRMYDACPPPKPSWAQLGAATRSVWLDRARLKLQPRHRPT
jgi:hypothetical protein